MKLSAHFEFLKNKSGFTIIEAFVAIVILGIVSMAVFSSLYSALSIINNIRENTIASTVIQEEIEKLRKGTFGELSTGEISFSSGSLSLLYNSSGKLKIDQYGDSDILRVVITVTWHNRLNTNKRHTKRIATLIARNGIHAL